MGIAKNADSKYGSMTVPFKVIDGKGEELVYACC